MTPETQAKISIYREKAAEGTLTLEEMKEAIKILREDRLAAHNASDASRAKRAKKEIRSADDLLKDLGL